MRSARINKLWDADIELFESMRSNYQSENEKRFFEHLYDAELWDLCFGGELLLHENDNEDKLYIMRVDFAEYEVGKDSLDVPNQHVQSLAAALGLNMKKCGFLDQDITLLQWLKNRDYKGIKYDQNRDFQ